MFIRLGRHLAAVDSRLRGNDGGGGNDGGSVTGFGWRNAIRIPAFAGMTAVGAGMTGGEARAWT